MCSIFSNLINNWFLVSKTMNWPGKEHDIWNQRTMGSEDRQAWLTLPIAKPQATDTDQNFSFSSSLMRIHQYNYQLQALF